MLQVPHRWNRALGIGTFRSNEQPFATLTTTFKQFERNGKNKNKEKRQFIYL